MGLLVWFMVLSFYLQPAMAVETQQNPAAAPADKNADIIRVLRDPVAREELIQTLESASNQAATSAPAPPAVKTSPAATPADTHAVKALENLSRSINAIQFGVIEILAQTHRLESLYGQFITHLLNAQDRKEWTILLLKCLVVVGFSYLIFYIANHYTKKLNVWFHRGKAKWLISKIFNLLLIWLLDLLPVATFAIVAYFILILLNINESAQWALLAWVSAFIIVKGLEVTFQFLFSVASLFPKLFSLSNTLVNFLQKWLVTLTAIIIYGYFIIQLALFFEILPDIYEILLKLWGLVIVIALITFLLNIPLRIIKIVESRRGRTDLKTLELEKIARIELIIRAAAIIYLFLLYLVWLVREDHFFWFVVKSTVFSIILIYFTVKAGEIIHSHLSRDFRVSLPLKKRLPGLEQRFRRYRRLFDIILRSFLYITITLVIIKIWSGKEVVWLPPLFKEILLIKMIAVACITLVTLLIWEISNSLVELSLTKNGEDLTLETGRAHTLLTVARKAIFVTLSLIAFLMVLSQFGMNIGPLLAGAGVLGLAISFGAQKLMQDLITGFFMLLENQIAVGDVVRLGEKSGTIEAISVRTVRLRDTGGVVHIIPYSSIVTVSNLTKDFSYYLFEISVAYRENVDEVIAVLHQIAKVLQNDPEYSPWILEPLEVMGLDKFADSAVIIKARFKTRPAMQWRVGREFNRRMKQKFDEMDIQIPFPHMMVFFGDKDGGAAPAS